MRTLYIIVGGLILWAAIAFVTRLMAGTGAAAQGKALIAFAIVWLLLAATNMWVGITRAGYSFMEELPIFLVIFALPVGVAALVFWRFIR